MPLVDVRPGLVKLLNSNSNINGIVAGRIYPIKIKQGETRDSIAYTRITEFETYTYTKPSALLSDRFQFDCWSRSTDSATVLANLVKETFGGFAGRIDFDPPSPSNFVIVQLIELVNGRDDYDADAQMYRMSRDYFVWFNERNA